MCLGEERRRRWKDELELKLGGEGLTIFTCFQNPTKNPVPTRERIVPTA